jgi:hypothetical protein
VTTMEAWPIVACSSFMSALVYKSWLASRPDLSPNVRRGYEDNWRPRVEPKFGNWPIGRILRENVQEWVNEMTTAGLGPRTVRWTPSVLRMTLDHAIADKKLRGTCSSVLPPRGSTVSPSSRAERTSPSNNLAARSVLNVLDRLVPSGSSHSTSQRVPDFASRLRIVIAQNLDAACHSTTSARIQRRCRDDNSQRCGPGESTPRSRFAAQSCSVDTGTPVMRDTSPAVIRPSP